MWYERRPQIPRYPDRGRPSQEPTGYFHHGDRCQTTLPTQNSLDELRCALDSTSRDCHNCESEAVPSLQYKQSQVSNHNFVHFWSNKPDLRWHHTLLSVTIIARYYGSLLLRYVAQKWLCTLDLNRERAFDFGCFETSFVFPAWFSKVRLDYKPYRTNNNVAI